MNSIVHTQRNIVMQLFREIGEGWSAITGIYRTFGNTLNPNDMKEWGVTEGEWYYLSSSKGRVKIRVRATKKSPPGTVFASFSFSDVPINVLTGGGYDPITETAELKVCPVKIEPIYNR